MQMIISAIKSTAHEVSIAHKIGAHVITDEARFPTPFDPVNETVRLSDSVERT